MYGLFSAHHMSRSYAGERGHSLHWVDTNPSFDPLMVLVLKHQGCGWLELLGSDPSGDPAFHGQGQGQLCVGTCLPVLSRETATAPLPGAQRGCYAECTYS